MNHLYDSNNNINKSPKKAVDESPIAIREIPDHATFREKEYTLGWLDKLGWFLSLALCNLANFDHLYFTKYNHYHFT